MDAPTPLIIENKLSFEHKIKIDNKEYIIKLDNTDNKLGFILNDSISHDLYFNSFSLNEIQKINNYFKMFDTINDVITNLNNLLEENKYKILVQDKSIIINFSPGIIIKGTIEFTLYIKEKSDKEKINELTLVTNSILKRLDLLEKENSELKNKVKELTEELNKIKNENNFFKDSVILTTKENREKMLNFIDKKIKNVNLLYRGTRDGDLAKNFHSACDNKGPTLTLCREKSGNIFGGYTEAEWDNKERHPKYDKNAFIFSITYDKKFVSQNYENSIECNPNYGPVFGFNGDLTIESKFLISENSMWTGQETYFDKKYEIVNGNHFFEVNELEVFSISI